MASAPPPAQEGAGASGDEDEKGNFMLFSKYLYLHIYEHLKLWFVFFFKFSTVVDLYEKYDLSS